MPIDPSHDWNDISYWFMQLQSPIGVDTVRLRAKQLPLGGDILDIGCGSGVPISVAMVEDRLRTVVGKVRIAKRWRRTLST